MIRGSFPLLFFLFTGLLWSSCCRAISLQPFFSVSNYRKLETTVISTHRYLERHRKAVKAALGASLVLYGGSFSTSMMFIHALGPSLPALNESITELRDTYLTTRATFDGELPSLLKAKENVLKLEKDVKSRKYKDAENEVKSLRAGGSAISHVISAIDPKETKKVIGSLYRTAVVGVAAAQNENIALINAGANIGNIVSNRLGEVGASLQSKFCQHNTIVGEKLGWNGASFTFLLQGLSVSIAYRFKQAAPVVSAAVVGSQMFTCAFDELIEPIVNKFPETTRARGRAVLQGSLIYYGCLKQLLPTAAAAVTGVPAPLSPLLGFENMLTKAFLK